MFPQYIIDRFNLVPKRQSRKNQYLSPWLDVLTSCFDLSKEFYSIAPYYPLDSDRDNHTEHWEHVSYGISDDDEKLLLFLQIKEPSALSGNPAAQEIDEEMRWLCTQVQERAAPVMYGVSAIGPRFRVYRFEKETGKISAPPSTSSLSKGLDEASPVSVESWNEDICSPDGYTRFMELINNVKEIAAKVPAT